MSGGRVAHESLHSDVFASAITCTCAFGGARLPPCKLSSTVRNLSAAPHVPHAFERRTYIAGPPAWAAASVGGGMSSSAQSDET